MSYMAIGLERQESYTMWRVVLGTLIYSKRKNNMKVTDDGTVQQSIKAAKSNMSHQANTKYHNQHVTVNNGSKWGRL